MLKSLQPEILYDTCCFLGRGGCGIVSCVVAPEWGGKVGHLHGRAMHACMHVLAQQPACRDHDATPDTT
eukprot:363989-Chlamydomonas_euryale.AAC.7